MLDKIYTSYYANIKKIPKEYTLISISRFAPKWLSNVKSHGKILSDKTLAPLSSILTKYKKDYNDSES